MKFYLLAIGVLAFAPFGASAPIAYVLNTNTTIDLVNVPTNASVSYGTTTFLSNSLALSPGGSLYSADNLGVIWDVTGPPIPQGPTIKTGIGDLDYANNGLWGYANTSSELFFFDLNVNAVTYSQVVTLPGGYTVTGVAFQPSNGDIFLSAFNGLNSDFLFNVPLFSATASPVGPMAHGDGFSYISDIDFDGSGTLYAMTWFHRWFYKVSTFDASTTFVSAGPHRDTTGMALNPVPEPTSLAGVLAGGLALYRRRHRS